MTKTLTQTLIVFLTLLLVSNNALADFDLKGKGNLIYPTGMKKPFEYGFGFKQSNEGYKFRVGEQVMNTTDLPAKYTIWISVHNNESIFVQEFTKGYFKEFDWTLGDHEVKLTKKVFKKRRVKGDYVLTINGEEFYFAKDTAQINIHFTQKGVRNIDTDGFVKDKSFSKY